MKAIIASREVINKPLNDGFICDEKLSDKLTVPQNAKKADVVEGFCFKVSSTNGFSTPINDLYYKRMQSVNAHFIDGFSPYGLPPFYYLQVTPNNVKNLYFYWDIEPFDKNENPVFFEYMTSVLYEMVTTAVDARRRKTLKVEIRKPIPELMEVVKNRYFYKEHASIDAYCLADTENYKRHNLMDFIHNLIELNSEYDFRDDKTHPIYTAQLLGIEYVKTVGFIPKEWLRLEEFGGYEKMLIDYDLLPPEAYKVENIGKKYRPIDKTIKGWEKRKPTYETIYLDMHYELTPGVVFHYEFSPKPKKERRIKLPNLDVDEVLKNELNIRDDRGVRRMGALQYYALNNDLKSKHIGYIKDFVHVYCTAALWAEPGNAERNIHNFCDEYLDKETVDKIYNKTKEKRYRYSDEALFKKLKFTEKNKRDYKKIAYSHKIFGFFVDGATKVEIKTIEGFKANNHGQNKRREAKSALRKARKLEIMKEIPHLRDDLNYTYPQIVKYYDGEICERTRKTYYKKGREILACEKIIAEAAKKSRMAMVEYGLDKISRTKELNDIKEIPTQRNMLHFFDAESGANCRGQEEEIYYEGGLGEFAKLNWTKKQKQLLKEKPSLPTIDISDFFFEPSTSSNYPLFFLASNRAKSVRNITY